MIPEQHKTATILMTLRGILFPVAGFLLLPLIIHIPGLWLAVPIAELLTALISIPLFRTAKQ